MVRILRLGRHRGLVAAWIALSIVAAGCGSSATDTSADVPSDPTAPATSEPEPSEAGVAESRADSPADDAAAPTVNLFPDVDVVRLEDGSTVNLAAELGGGDLPVLLWFWAPH